MQAPGRLPHIGRSFVCAGGFSALPGSWEVELIQQVDFGQFLPVSAIAGSFLSLEVVLAV